MESWVRPGNEAITAAYHFIYTLVLSPLYMHTSAVKGFARNRRKRTTHRRLYSHTCYMQSSTEFQKFVRTLVREEKEFEIKLQYAREFARLKKKWSTAPLATKSKLQSVTRTKREAGQKPIPQVHMQKRSEEWMSMNNGNYPSNKRGNDMVSDNKLSDVWLNTELQPQTQDNSVNMMDLKFGDNQKGLLPPLEHQEQLIFGEHNLLPLPTSEQLHQDS